MYLNHRKRYNIQNQKPTVFFKHKPTIAEHVPVIIVSFVGGPAICSFHFFAALYLNPFSFPFFPISGKMPLFRGPKKYLKIYQNQVLAVLRWKAQLVLVGAVH